MLPFLWITPAGWLNSLFLQGVVNGDWLWFALVIPMALLATTVPSSLRRLLEMHRAREPVYFRWPEVTAEEAWAMPASAPGYAGLRPPTRSGPTAIEDAIRERSFLPEPEWPKAGMLERWVARWLTPREKTVANFVYLYPSGWTMNWKAAAKILAVALPLSLIVARLGNGWFLGVFGIGSAIAAFAALPITDLNWWGFRSAQVGAVGTPIHAFFPFSYGEIARVIFKVAAVRVLASLPLLAILAAVGAWHYGENAGRGALLVCNVAALFLCLNPLLVALAFSSQTSDYKLSTLRSWVFVMPFLFGAFLEAILTIVQLGILVLMPEKTMAVFLVPIIGLISYALFRWHQFAYDRCWFDTLKIAR